NPPRPVASGTAPRRGSRCGPLPRASACADVSILVSDPSSSSFDTRLHIEGRAKKRPFRRSAHKNGHSRRLLAWHFTTRLQHLGGVDGKWVVNAGWRPASASRNG